MNFDDARAAIKRRPALSAAAKPLLRASSWASHLARTPRSTEPDLAVRMAFRTEFRAFEQRNAVDGRFPMRWEDRYPQLGDRTASIPFEPHYLYHPAWAARCIARIAPERHVDVSSSMHLMTVVSAFVDVDYYEFRPTPLRGLTGITSRQGDLAALPFADGSVTSLSCLHVIEHLGLGRYGDPVDPTGDRRAFAELRRSLAPGGDLLIAVPVGPPRIRFNAHRVYAVEQVLAELDGLELHEFALVLEDGSGIVFGDEAIARVPEQSQTPSAGTGCFWLKRPA
jgi:SAM-dependent methyltransferase